MTSPQATISCWSGGPKKLQIEHTTTEKLLRAGRSRNVEIANPGLLYQLIVSGDLETAATVDSIWFMRGCGWIVRMSLTRSPKSRLWRYQYRRTNLDGIVPRR